ncbi:hypothetical protein MRB53_022379 [Persea americana]|uniref:Uncharacterized protein n=1 Tax=Persea americana TaxID=3435 RepID=A0ACC2L6M2_PERAE|nr:hypothetical protein MRB53_022379 [Persea americana]
MHTTARSISGWCWEELSGVVNVLIILSAVCCIRCSSLLCVWGWAILVDQDFLQLWHLQKSLTLLAPPSGCGLCGTASTYTVKMIIPFVIFPFHFYKLKKSI